MRKALIETVARLSEFLSIDAREAAGEEFRGRVEAALAQARRALLPPERREVETFLTRKAQEAWPDAIVYRVPPDQGIDRPFYFLDRKPEDEADSRTVPEETRTRVLLGRDFGEAREALAVMRRSAVARRSDRFLP